MGLYSGYTRNTTPTMANQREKNMEHEVETEGVGTETYRVSVEMVPQWMLPSPWKSLRTWFIILQTGASFGIKLLGIP